MSEKGHLFYILGFLLFAYVYKSWHEGFASTFLFYVSAVIAGYEGIVYFTAFRHLHVDRSVGKKRLQAGSTQEIVIKVKRKNRFPMSWYAAYETLPKGMAPVPGQIVFPWFRKEFEFRYQIPNLPRGVFKLDEIVMISGDLFGLFKTSKAFSIPDEFIVHPKYSNLKDWMAKDGQKHGVISLTHRSSNDLSSIVGIRDYQKGDRLSQIHWKSAARTGQLKTKEFEHQVSNDVVIFLNTSKEAFGTRSSFEKAVSLAASLVAFASQRQLKYGVIFEGIGGEAKYFGGSMATDFYRIMDELAAVSPNGKASFPEIAGMKLNHLSKGTHLVFITSKLTPKLSLLLAEWAAKNRKVELFCVEGHRPAITDEGYRKMAGSGVILHYEMV